MHCCMHMGLLWCPLMYWMCTCAGTVVHACSCACKAACTWAYNSACSCTRKCTCAGSGKHACACACKAACTWAYNGARSCTRKCTCAGTGKHACACACKAACTWAYNGTRACTCADDFHVAIPATNVQQSTVIITSMATYSSAYQLPARRICAGGVSDLACAPPSAVRIQLARWQAQVTQVWVVRSKTIDPTAHGGRPNTYDPRVTSA